MITLRTGCIVIAMGAMTLGLTAPTFAQQNEEITVQAPRTIHRNNVDRNSIGIPIEEVSLNRRVSYADLNLHRSADRNELARRINVTAQEACSQLNTLYPADLYPPQTTDRDCVKDAVDSGMMQARSLTTSN